MSWPVDLELRVESRCWDGCLVTVTGMDGCASSGFECDDSFSGLDHDASGTAAEDDLARTAR